MKRFTFDEWLAFCSGMNVLPPDDIVEKENELFLSGAKHIDIPLSVIEVMKREKERREQRERECAEVSAHRLAGMVAESTDPERSIEEYIQCIEKGERSQFDLFHSYAHAYKRLIILLHKAKDYGSEAEYIRGLLFHELDEKERERYLERMNKLTLLL